MAKSIQRDLIIATVLFTRVWSPLHENTHYIDFKLIILDKKEQSLTEI